MCRLVNVFACLVHEQPECVLDLVRNLRSLDPDSPGLLYNGGGDPGPLFYDPIARRAWRYAYPPRARPWVSGGTLCYHKAFWVRHPFPDMNEGADTRYPWGNNGAQVRAHPEDHFHVATVHPFNTSPRRLDDARYQPRPPEEVEDLLGPDLAFYRRWSLDAGLLDAHPRS